jgi:hypothetical protein
MVPNNFEELPLFLKRDGKDTVGKLNYQGLIKLFLIFSNFFLQNCFREHPIRLISSLTGGKDKEVLFTAKYIAYYFE